MVQIKNIDILLSILKQLDSNEQHYQLYGAVEEKGASISVLGAPDPHVKLCANIIALTSIGELYLHQTIMLDDRLAVSEFKEKLSALNITSAVVKVSNGTVSIE